ncbi:MAG: outer membrane beta-barrel protein [Bacteroidota bacterium]
MKIAIAFTGFLLTFFHSYSQDNSKRISGQVKDTRNEPVPSATVRLLNAADSIVVETKMTKENGKFVFDKLSSTIYRVQVTSAGNKMYSGGPLTLDDNHPEIILPVIILLPAKTMELKEVTVTAKRPLIEQELDKTIVNADAMIGSAAGNTLEILEKTPGVTIDQDGSISLNGNGGVMVLIDGRTIYMSGADLAAYLRSLPGSMVDKIELMTNPPAKYDAGGNAIINIRLKRNRIKGYTGTVSVNGNLGKETFRSYNAAGINYLNRKVNLFVNAAYSRDANTSNDQSVRSFYNPGGVKTSELEIVNRFRYRSREISGRVGMDYTFTPKTVAGFVFNYGYRPRTEENDYRNNNDTYSSPVDSAGSGMMNGKFRWKNLSANGNFTHRFDDKGKELSIDLNYIRYLSRGEQVLQNTISLPSADSSYDFLYQLQPGIRIYNAKADYTHPIGRLKLSAGTKFSWVESDSQSDYYDMVMGLPSADLSKSNHFIYRENINAVYVNGRRDWKRISMQLGMRLENTATKGEQRGNAVVAGSVVQTNYTNLFPSVFASYKLDSAGKHTLSASFSKRLNRPNYQLLNPFLIFRDQYSYGSGNPFLGPVYGTRFELSYRFSQYLGLTVQHDRLTDNIIDVTEAEGNIFITQPDNRGSGHMTGFIINSNYSPVKGWTMNLDARTALFYNKTILTGDNVILRQQAYRANLFNQFTFRNDWSAEVFAMWTSRIIQWQRIVEPRWRVNGAIQKKILKKKGAIKIKRGRYFL